MSQCDPRCVVRIAIALAVLKRRPRDQSIASYLLDLQSQFPLATRCSESRDWRTYALELEKQLATLKDHRDADQELLAKLPTDASQISSTSDGPPPKKKSKKNPTKEQQDSEWSWDQSRADWSRVLSSQYPSAPSLSVAYGSLKGALAAPNADLSYASRLTEAILRALDIIYVFLFWDPALDAQTQSADGAPARPKPEHIDSTRIALASPLLTYLLRTTLHTLVRTVQDSTKSKRSRQRLHTTVPFSDAYAHVDRVVDRLLEYVLLPLLRAINPLCHARLAPLVSTPLKKDGGNRSRTVGKGKEKDKRTGPILLDLPKQMDVRTDVFALIGTALDALDALPPLLRPSGPGGADSDSIAGGVRDRLGLETIRELESLYTVPLPTPAPATTHPSSSLHLPLPTSLPEPLSNPTPPSAPSEPRSQPEPQARAQRGTTAEPRAKLLERLTGTRAERVRALATRDAGWFLASTLNLCVTPPRQPAPAAAVHARVVPCGPAAGRTDASGRLLREALLDRIGKLIRSAHGAFGDSVSGAPGEHPNRSSDVLDGRTDTHDCNVTDSKFAVDPVCRNMLLAICERALGHLSSP